MSNKEKKDEDKVEEGPHVTAAKDSMLSRGGDKLWEYSGKAIKGIAKWVSSSVRGTLAGVWNASGGAVVSGVVGLAQHIDKSYSSIKQVGKETQEAVKERHHIGKLGPVIKGIMSATAISIGSVLYSPLAVAGGAASSVTHGAQNVVDAVTMQYDKHTGTTAKSRVEGNGGH